MEKRRERRKKQQSILNLYKYVYFNHMSFKLYMFIDTKQN